MLLFDSLNDNELLDYLKNEDERAIVAIYKKYWEPIFSTAFNLFQDKEACEDIVQEIFINLWNKRQEIEIKVSLKAYLYASMRYEIYRQIRLGSVRETIFEDINQRLSTPSPHHVLEYKELLCQISSIVETLPERCKEVYKLSREEQLSHKEISKILNISTKTVENHLTKALRVLRMPLGQLVLLEFIIPLL